LGLDEVFNALGGGLLGLFGVVIAILSGLLLQQLNVRLKERDVVIADLKKEKEAALGIVKDLTAAVNRQTDVIEAWTPAAQRRVRS
jgi:hypothetical protein